MFRLGLRICSCVLGLLVYGPWCWCQIEVVCLGKRRANPAEGTHELLLHLLDAVLLAIGLKIVSPWLRNLSWVVVYTFLVVYGVEAAILLAPLPQTGKVSCEVAAELESVVDHNYLQLFHGTLRCPVWAPGWW